MAVPSGLVVFVAWVCAAAATDKFCTHQGSRREINEEWLFKDKFLLTCDPETLKTKLVYCQTPNGFPIDPNESLIEGTTRYTCEVSANSAKLRENKAALKPLQFSFSGSDTPDFSKICFDAHSSGSFELRKLGDEWQEDHLLLDCRMKNGSPEITPIGCVTDAGSRIDFGDSVVENGHRLDCIIVGENGKHPLVSLRKSKFRNRGPRVGSRGIVGASRIRSQSQSVPNPSTTSRRASVSLGPRRPIPIRTRAPPPTPRPTPRRTRPTPRPTPRSTRRTPRPTRRPRTNPPTRLRLRDPQTFSRPKPTKVGNQGCFGSGIIRKPGEKWQDILLLYECEEYRGRYRTVIIGCLSPNQQQVFLGNTITDGRFRYTCEGSKTSARIIRSEFSETRADQSGRSRKRCKAADTWLDDGEEITVRDVVKRCKISEEETSLEVVGCQSDKGDMIPVGTERKMEGFVYRCLKLGQSNAYLRKSTLREASNRRSGNSGTPLNASPFSRNSASPSQEKPPGCQIGRKFYKNGEEFEEREGRSGFIKKCTADKFSMQTSIVACLTPSDKRVELGNSETENGLTWNCLRRGNGARLEAESPSQPVGRRQSTTTPTTRTATTTRRTSRPRQTKAPRIRTTRRSVTARPTRARTARPTTTRRTRRPVTTRRTPRPVAIRRTPRPRTRTTRRPRVRATQPPRTRRPNTTRRPTRTRVTAAPRTRATRPRRTDPPRRRTQRPPTRFQTTRKPLRTRQTPPPKKSSGSSANFKFDCSTKCQFGRQEICSGEELVMQVMKHGETVQKCQNGKLLPVCILNAPSNGIKYEVLEGTYTAVRSHLLACVNFDDAAKITEPYIFENSSKMRELLKDYHYLSTEPVERKLPARN